MIYLHLRVMMLTIISHVLEVEKITTSRTLLKHFHVKIKIYIYNNSINILIKIMYKIIIRD